MLYFIRHGLGSWRQSCFVEINDRTGRAESGYWASSLEPLTEEDLDTANEFYSEYWRRELLAYAAEEQWERDQDK